MSQRSLQIQGKVRRLERIWSGMGGGCNCSFRVPGLSGSGFRVDLEGSGFSLSLRFYDGVSGLYGV